MEIVEALNRIADELRINRSPEELIARAKKLSAAGDVSGAEQIYKSMPDNFMAMFEYSILLMQRDEYDLAVKILYKIKDIQELPEIHNNIAYCFSRTHSYYSAIWHYRKSLELRPQHYDTLAYLGLEQLRAGEWQEGWELFEYRNYFNGKFSDRFVKGRLKLWTCEDLYGKSIYVSKEQGFGDAIQFIRYLPALAKAAKSVTWLCEPALLKLFQQSFKLDNVTFVDSSEEIEPHDYWIYQMSLAKYFKASGEPYLVAEPRTLESDKPKIGLSWKGNSRHANDNHRSLKLYQFDKFPEASYYSLQKLNPNPEEIVNSRLRVIDIGLGDFDDTASVIGQLDLVITVDTAIAHLAGALGKECWLILPYFGSDWRWGFYKQTNRLYKNMTSYWMPKPHTLPDKLFDDLSKFIDNRS